MSKLTPKLKAAINANWARPDTLPAPSNIRHIYESIAQDASEKNVGLQSWLTLATAATVTMNSPESLAILHQFASSTPEPSPDPDLSLPVFAAELMRETCLKAISFNGIPRIINNLNAFRDSLPKEVAASLSTTPSREPTSNNLPSIKAAGRGLWTSIYHSVSDKLLARLARSHPDLPVHIMNSHYGPLLADPLPKDGPHAKVGRVLTSVAAVACLRAQGGVGPQVISHILGLRKAYEDGSCNAEGEQEVPGGRWLASEEGNLWLLDTVDRIVQAIGKGEGTAFAPGLKAKL